MSEIEVCPKIMPRFDLDCILLAEAQRRGVGMLVGRRFNSGLLAGEHPPGPTHDYRPADTNTLRRAERIY